MSEVDVAPGGARTLDNGLAVLAALARTGGGRTVAELAHEVGLDRTVVHRLVVSLAHGRLAARRADGRYEVGARVLDLAAAVRTDLRYAAEAVLPALAERLGATSHVSVRDGDEVVSVAVVEPRSTAMHVAYRVGTRHRVDQGAAGLAILLAAPPRPGERRELRAARRNGGLAVSARGVLPLAGYDPTPRATVDYRTTAVAAGDWIPWGALESVREDGYAVTRGEIEVGAWGLAAPVPQGAAPVTASVGVVALRPLTTATVTPAVLEAAAALGRLTF